MKRRISPCLAFLWASLLSSGCTPLRQAEVSLFPNDELVMVVVDLPLETKDRQAQRSLLQRFNPLAIFNPQEWRDRPNKSTTKAMFLVSSLAETFGFEEDLPGDNRFFRGGPETNRDAW